ncbi:MAG: AbrB/MazE/SpoVT family DNA-binding domain-containing protein [Methyloversatilis sp.]|nr:AbrB/MazE/SpoVT family DNA-binding domain-containing protein [Methyloversatilis sp.]
MTTSTLTSKGQITVPQAVRTALGLQTGDKVDFVADGAGFRIVPLRADVRNLKGRFAGRADAPVSIEDMDAAIADAAAGIGNP